jgi:hypothetical protein
VEQGEDDALRLSALGGPRGMSGGVMKTANKRRYREPSRRSLNEIPEVDVRTARVKRNPYARRIAQEGLVVQVGRGRPKRFLECRAAGSHPGMGAKGGVVKRIIGTSPRESA